MKLNLEIELDWIDEENNLDETVKQEIINSIVGRIGDKIEKQIEKKINVSVDDIVTGKVNTLTENMFNDFINRPISISDRWGDTVKSYNKLSDLIKERFDNFMEQSVDDNGKTDTSSYGTKYKRLEYIIDKQLKDYANKFTSDAVKEVKDEIKAHVQEGLTTKLGVELMKVLKINDMLKIEK